MMAAAALSTILSMTQAIGRVCDNSSPLEALSFHSGRGAFSGDLGLLTGHNYPKLQELLGR